MKQYYFVFCKDDLMLERQADGTYTIPLQGRTTYRDKALDYDSKHHAPG